MTANTETPPSGEEGEVPAGAVMGHRGAPRRHTRSERRIVRTGTSTKVPVGAWRNRITGHADDAARTSSWPTPANWRTHPKEQQRGLGGALGEVGWVAQVIVNTTTGHVVDGHLRVELALSRNEPTVPVTYVELSRRGGAARPRDTRSPRPRWRPPRRTRSPHSWPASSPRTTSWRRCCGSSARSTASSGRCSATPTRSRRSPTTRTSTSSRATCGCSATTGSCAATPRTRPPSHDCSMVRARGSCRPIRRTASPSIRRGGTGPVQRPGTSRAARYMRIEGHRNTTLSGDTRVDWSRGVRARALASRSATSGTPASTRPRSRRASSGSASRSRAR